MRALLLLSVALALAGCFDPTGKYPERRFYVVESVREGPAREPARGASLVIRKLAVSRAFEGREMVYRLEDAVFESDFYHAFFVDPAEMLTSATREWIGAAGLFEHVLTTGSYAPATHILEGSVVALYGDYRDRGRPLAHLEVQFLLLDDRVDPPKPVLHRTYLGRVETGDDSVSALVEGWNEALRRILSALEEDLLAAETAVE